MIRKTPMNTRLTGAVAALSLALALVACGSSATPAASTTAAQPPTTSGPSTPAGELRAAERPFAGMFPPATGKTLKQLATVASSQAQLQFGTGVLTPGTRRAGFGLNTSSGAFIYVPTAVYIATGPNAPARGPFLAPADPLTVAPGDRSKQNSGPGGILAFYETSIPFPHAGSYTMLSLSRTASGFVGASGGIHVARSSSIPQVGQIPPAIATDTRASVGSRIDLLTTRIPPESMQAVSFKDALGKRPIALLFSTPQFCTSRVCGPVTDILVELQHRFGDRVAFIHQEVFVNNQPNRGERPQMAAFHLQTEPWLFTIDRAGRIAARLEGAFGVNDARQAIEAALR